MTSKATIHNDKWKIFNSQTHGLSKATTPYIMTTLLFRTGKLNQKLQWQPWSRELETFLSISKIYWQLDNPAAAGSLLLWRILSYRKLPHIMMTLLSWTGNFTFILTSRQPCSCEGFWSQIGNLWKATMYNDNSADSPQFFQDPDENSGVGGGDDCVWQLWRRGVEEEWLPVL